MGRRAHVLCAAQAATRIAEASSLDRMYCMLHMYCMYCTYYGTAAHPLFRSRCATRREWR